MFQFYYAEGKVKIPKYRLNIHDHINIDAVKPSVWEEHCLECSAPDCYTDCKMYEARKDGRCKRTFDGISVREDVKGCCGRAAHFRFKRWSNLLMVINPSMLSWKDYQKINEAHEKIGNGLQRVINSRIPQKAKWGIVRSVEYCRRTYLRNRKKNDVMPDAFVFHGFSYSNETFRLLMEVYVDGVSTYKKSLKIAPGENLIVMECSQLDACYRGNSNVVKVYPEGDREAELDVLWMDFVRGKHIARVPKIKCVVWDLDNTIWENILAELDDDSSIRVKDEALAFMEYLDERGILQSVASKNDYEQTWPVIKRLKLDRYFLYPQINWEPKSLSMKIIAEALNIGIDTLALIDDMPFEREQVRHANPQIRVYDPAEIQSLYSLPEFDVMITEESKNRRQMYQEEEKREKIRKSENAGLEEFIATSRMSAEVFVPESKEELARCFELLNRTNQLNMTGHKYEYDEFCKFSRQAGKRSLCFSCADIYGMYGIVGYCQYRIENEQLIFIEFTMSCRTAGKYIESAFFEFLLRITKCKTGKLCLIKNSKNERLMKTLEEIGFQIVAEDEMLKEYTFSKGLKNGSIVKVSCKNS